VTGPEVGQHVRVIAPTGVPIDARIEGGGHTSYLLGISIGDGDPVPMLADKEVGLEFTNRRGVCRLVGTAHAAAGTRALHFETDGEIDLIQRRDYVRVEAYVPVTYQPLGPGGFTVTAHTRDVSGGGVQVADAQALRLGDELPMTLELGEGEEPVAVVAEVVREIGERGFGLRFVDIDPNERQRVIRWVFARERLARQVGRVR
jgi:hypothetical protein